MSTKENNLKEKFRIALNSTAKVISDDFDLNKKNLEDKDLGLLIINHLVPAKNPIGIRYMEDLFSGAPYDFLLARDNDKIVISKNSDEITVN